MILDVARREISEHGFEGVSIRSIARRARVDPRLVRHYFGSKERLLLHAVQADHDPDQLVEKVLRGSASSVGRRTVKALLEYWDNPRTAGPSLARLSAALTSDEMAALILDEFVSRYCGALVRQYSPDHRELRTALVASQMMGVAFSRYLVHKTYLATYPQADLIRVVGRTVQHYLTAPLPELADERPVRVTNRDPKRAAAPSAQRARARTAGPAAGRASRATKDPSSPSSPAP
jgi:AcrR family transcriptional regulator